MELRRILSSRRYSAAICKCIFAVLFIVFGFSLFIRNGPNTNNPETEPTSESPHLPESAQMSDDKITPLTTHFIASKFIAQFYEEEGIPYDNYCQVEMESRKLRVKEICSLYLQTDLIEREKSLLTTTPSERTDRKIQFRAFMGKIRHLPGAFGDRIIERTELSEAPNLDNVEIDQNRKMFLCAPHKVGSQTWRHFFERLKIRDGINETEIFTKKTSFPSDVAFYTKAFQVRHPFERLLSAYRFIFEREAMRASIQDLKNDIIAAFPFLPSEMEAAHYYLNDSTGLVPKSQFDIIPNFRQFAEHVTKSGPDFGVAQYAVVSHWLPYYFSCSPCDPEFLPSIVIRMESILKDTLCFLDAIPTIDYDDLAKLHHVNQSPNGHSSNKTLQLEYFATLSKETMKKLYDRYKPDFLLYGYNLDEFLPLATS